MFSQGLNIKVVRVVRRTYYILLILRMDGTKSTRTRTGDRELIGMPTAAERRARTDAALARLASVGPEPPPARLTAVYQQMIDGRLTR